MPQEKNQQTKNNNDKDLHKGHRRRMMDKYVQNGIHSFEDHEVLEILLFMAYSRKNTNEIAHRLLNHFGSIDKILNSSPKELETVCDVGRNTAVFLAFIKDFIAWYSDKTDIPKKLNNFQEMQDYCVSLFKFKKIEEIHAVFLDSNNNLLKEYCVGSGGFSKISLNFKDLLSLIIDTKCERLVLTHNHPNSSSVPSQSDISITVDIRNILLPVNIELVDHIVVGENNAAFSMLSHGLI